MGKWPTSFLPLLARALGIGKGRLVKFQRGYWELRSHWSQRVWKEHQHAARQEGSAVMMHEREKLMEKWSSLHSDMRGVRDRGGELMPARAAIDSRSNTYISQQLQRWTRVQVQWDHNQVRGQTQIVGFFPPAARPAGTPRRPRRTRAAPPPPPPPPDRPPARAASGTRPTTAGGGGSGAVSEGRAEDAGPAAKGATPTTDSRKRKGPGGGAHIGEPDTGRAAQSRHVAGSRRKAGRHEKRTSDGGNSTEPNHATARVTPWTLAAASAAARRRVREPTSDEELEGARAAEDQGPRMEGIDRARGQTQPQLEEEGAVAQSKNRKRRKQPQGKRQTKITRYGGGRGTGPRGGGQGGTGTGGIEPD